MTDSDIRGSLRSIYGTPSDRAIDKVSSRLTETHRQFIAHSPFLLISSASAQGSADLSPRGDPAGFVLVLDSKTLAIPDRPGNRRLDTMTNILENPHTSVLFVVPGVNECLRINGRARLSRSPRLLQDLAEGGKPALLAVVVEIDEVFHQCARAMMRAALWHDRSPPPGLARMSSRPDEAYRTRLYRETQLHDRGVTSVSRGRSTGHRRHGVVAPDVRIVGPDQVRRLRHGVLRPHQPYEKTLYSEDHIPGTMHFGAFAAPRRHPIGVMSVFLEQRSGGGTPGWRVRGMAVDASAQGIGIGTALLSKVLPVLWRMGASELWCNARTSAVAFYRKAGFATVGGAFELPGLGEHHVLVRRAPRERREACRTT